MKKMQKTIHSETIEMIDLGWASIEWRNMLTSTRMSVTKRAILPGTFSIGMMKLIHDTATNRKDGK